MKRFINAFIILSIFVFSKNVYAASLESNTIKIQENEMNKIAPEKCITNDDDFERAIHLIEEIAIYENSLSTKIPYSSVSATEEIKNVIEKNNSELLKLGVKELTTEEIYHLHGMDMPDSSKGEPSVPDDTNYVRFYSIKSYPTINGTQYETFSIVAYSKGKPQTSLNVPMYKGGTYTLYNQKAYISDDFKKYINLTSSIGSMVCPNDEVLGYLSSVWDLASYFNPTAQQEVTMEYAIQQTFVYTYVKVPSTSYYDFLQTAERKAGYFILKFAKYSSGTPTIKSISAVNWEAKSSYYSNYKHAVQLLLNESPHKSYQVGSIKIKLGSTIKKTITMTYYDSIFDIPGV